MKSYVYKTPNYLSIIFYICKTFRCRVVNNLLKVDHIEKCWYIIRQHAGLYIFVHYESTTIPCYYYYMLQRYHNRVKIVNNSTTV